MMTVTICETEIVFTVMIDLVLEKRKIVGNVMWGVEVKVGC